MTTPLAFLYNLYTMSRFAEIHPSGERTPGRRPNIGEKPGGPEHVHNPSAVTTGEWQPAANGPINPPTGIPGERTPENVERPDAPRRN